MKKDNYISIKILKSDLAKINIAFDYAISYLKEDAKDFKRITKKDSMGLLIAQRLSNTYKRINDNRTED